jgi:hypothetical protein
LFEFESQKQDMTSEGLDFGYWIQKSDMEGYHIILKSSILSIICRDKEKTSHIYILIEYSRRANMCSNWRCLIHDLVLFGFETQKLDMPCTVLDFEH